MTLTRDSYGIPYLWADDVQALARLQGRVTAHDRAWQIEVERRRCHGTLAARLGAGHLPWDRFARRADLAGTARAAFGRLDGPTRRWLDSYVAGVNDALADAAAHAPEFAAHGCRPGRWLPWDPLGVFLVQHVLFGTIGDKLWRSHLTDTLGPRATPLFAIESSTGSGSNAWVVAKGPNGAPVIAGDPHRVIEMPGVYQQIGLACAEFDVVGLAFPGVPGVAHFGHAGSVAWAVTNAMADYQDLYTERLHRDGTVVTCRSPGGWQPVEVRTESIDVLGAPAEPVEIIRTPRGPVIDTDRRTGEAIALRTPAMVDRDLGFGALLPLLRARTADDVVRALRSWVEPVNSVLIADSTGAVCRTVAGRVPVRDESCRQGPVPGWDPRYAWTGYARLPTAPIEHRYVAANDRRPGDTAEFGVDFAPAQRARRIAELLAAGGRPERILRDTEADVTWLHTLLGRVSGTGGRAEALRRRLLGWDGRMRADSVDAGLFAAWRAALARSVATHPALRTLHRPSPFDPLFTPWLEPTARIARALPALAVSGGRIGVDLAGSAAAALTETASRQARSWGAGHVLDPVRVATDPATVAAVVRIRARSATDGDTDCVLATSSIPGVDDACRRGPVARYVWDLADRAASRWVVPLGASGRPGDPHHADQLAPWLAGELIPIDPPAADRPRRQARLEPVTG